MNFITLALVTWLHLTPALGHSWVERVNRYHDREVQLAASGYARGNGDAPFANPSYEYC